MPFDEDWLKLPGELRHDRPANRTTPYRQPAQAGRNPRFQPSLEEALKKIESLATQTGRNPGYQPSSRPAKAGLSWPVWFLIAALPLVGARLIGWPSNDSTQDQQVQESSAAGDQHAVLPLDSFANQIEVFVKRQLESFE